MTNYFKNIILGIMVLAGLFIKIDLAAQSREALIKAGFIEKFTHFIQWPEQTLNDNPDQFIIKVIGDNTFENVLEDLFGSTSVQHKEVIIDYISSVEEIEYCNILFISGSEKNYISEILEYTSGKPILTISDTEGFGQLGVMINLFPDGNYIRYEVNKTAIETSILDFNSLLLSYAVILDSNG